MKIVIAIFFFCSSLSLRTVSACVHEIPMTCHRRQLHVRAKSISACEHEIPVSCHLQTTCLGLGQRHRIQVQRCGPNNGSEQILGSSFGAISPWALVYRKHSTTWCLWILETIVLLTGIVTFSPAILSYCRWRLSCNQHDRHIFVFPLSVSFSICSVFLKAKP